MTVDDVDAVAAATEPLGGHNLLRGHILTRIEHRSRQLFDEKRDAIGFLDDVRQQLFLRLMPVADAGGAFELSYHWMKRAIGIVRQALVCDTHVRIGHNRGSELLGQT